MKPPAPVTHTVTAMGARPGNLPNRQVVAAVAEMRGRRREIKIDPSRNFADEGQGFIGGAERVLAEMAPNASRSRHVDRESRRAFFFTT